MNINKKYSKKFSFINIIVNFYLMLGHANIITELEQTKSENSLETFKNASFSIVTIPLLGNDAMNSL